VTNQHFGAEEDNDTDANDEGSEENLLDGQGLEGDDGESDEGDSGNESPKEIDLESALAEIRDGTMTKKDFAAFQAGLNRQLGQVKTLQSTVAKLSKNAVDPDDVRGIGELLGAISDALPSVLDPSEPAMAGIRAIQEKRARAEATRDAIAAVRAESDDTPASDDGTGNGLSKEDAAAWNAASSAVNGYARGKGIDPESIEKAVWDKAVAGSMGLPDRAADLMYEVIDGLAKGTDSKQSNRAARKAAGEAGSPGKSGGGASSTLTLAKLQAMTPEQVMKLPAEEVDAILAQS
jgi:hypothetical protein